MKVWVPGAALVALAGAGSLASAQTPATYDVAWEREAGAEACPDRTEFVAAIQERIGAHRLEAGSPRRLDVRLSRAPDKWRAELRMVENGAAKGSQLLESEGTDCSGLFAALVAVAAVTLGDAPEPSPEPAAEPTPARKTDEPAPPAPVAAPIKAPKPKPAPAREPRVAQPAAPRWSRWSLGFDVVQDNLFAPNRSPVCTSGEGPMTCFENGRRFEGTPMPGTDNRVTAGWMLGNWRLLAGVHFAHSERLILELRGGRAFGDHSPDFVPWHVETLIRHWLANPQARLRGFLAGGVGLAQFDAGFRVKLQDCRGLPNASQCLARQQPGTTKELVAYYQLGILFATARIGAAWTFTDGHAFTLGLWTSYTFPRSGFVLQPAAGYRVEL